MARFSKLFPILVALIATVPVVGCQGFDDCDDNYESRKITERNELRRKPRETDEARPVERPTSAGIYPNQP